MPSVRVLYFAQLRERLNCAEETLTLPENTDSTAVLALIAERHPQARDVIASARLAVDCAFVSGAVTLCDGAELAVITPVSGG